MISQPLDRGPAERLVKSCNIPVCVLRLVSIRMGVDTDMMELGIKLDALPNSPRWDRDCVSRFPARMFSNNELQRSQVL
ncbi:hypothetical protein SK128_007717 [Halocaridina rubra]|uniref:Uncharacterized protein n=1 Tax=Halocaridina rubra TaxID=373956 RepID=A0AAN9AD24_HALRR